MTRAPWIFIGAVALQAAAAATPEPAPPATLRPADFAYALPIAIAGKEAFYGFRLPAAVYRGLTRRDRGDLRIFDAQDRIMQHALRLAPAVPEAAPGTAPALALPLFPLPAAAPGGAPDTDLHVRVDARGAVVDISGAPAATQPAARYLLDASALETRIESLRFVWAETAKPLVVPLRLECSGDLEHWNTLATASLADLQAGGHRLRQDSLTMPALKCRYLRFDWPGASTQLERVEATPVSPHVAPPTEPLERIELAGTTDGEGAYRYESDGVFPVTSLDFAFAGPNTVLEAIVQVRDSEQAPWRDLYHGLVYDYAADGKTLRSRPIPLPETGSRYWRVKPVPLESAPPAPRLVLGWRGDPLVFVNSGTPPYRLVYGSLKAGPTGASIASLFGTRPPPVTPATLGEPIELAGKGALRPPLPWQRYLLWTILALGVAGLGRMALKLWKEMGRPA